uniref:Uncharacterized protein n=1 Tax=Vespula pensylvanica TaxID=30213 RepID=A0A834UIC5_VESPE|nr:hypothetical protein H0235_002028 [Vespula pensylvanica]
MAAREKRTAEKNRNFRMFRKLRLELDFTLTTTRNRLLIYVWHNNGTVTRQGPEKERLSLQGNDYELRKRQERCLRDARTSAKVKAA